MSKVAALMFVAVFWMVGAAAADTTLTTTTYVGTIDGFHATSTLVMGQDEAILIDAQFDLADAHRVAAMILDSKKKLTTIYVTHGHPDHYLGLGVLHAVFPKARLVAMPAVVAEIKATWKDKLAQWRPVYGDLLPRKATIPAALKGTTLTIEGQTLEIHGPRQGDDAASTYVWIPSIKTVIAGDVAYRGVHPWTAETNADQRSAWIATLDEIRALEPTVVIPGHRDPRLADDVGALVATRDYLVAFDAAVSSSSTAAEARQKIKTRFPALLIDAILERGAAAQFPIASR